ncbi:hypothetical protein [Bacillus solitudinis]|uniref:hypothetical protein n=1 Tax=Bacillus solitudinis TaxID=2014074 RepID=UPI000C23F428|nr:hypothetical protein [Bacillus solitudinis]
MFERIITKYKKWLETYHLYSYSIEENGKNYHFVQYSRFNKPTDGLVLDEQGNVTDVVTAQKIAKTVLVYNSCMINSLRLDQMRAKEEELPKEMTVVLMNLQNINIVPAQLKLDIEQVIKAYKEHIDGQEILDEIGKNIDHLDIEQVRRNNLLTSLEAQKANDLENSFDEHVYRQALSMHMTVENRKNILNWITEKQQENLSPEVIEKMKEAESLLEHSLKSVVLATLKRSVQNFENKVSPLTSVDFENRVNEYIKKIKEIERVRYENHVKLLRNP